MSPNLWPAFSLTIWHVIVRSHPSGWNAWLQKWKRRNQKETSRCMELQRRYHFTFTCYLNANFFDGGPNPSGRIKRKVNLERVKCRTCSWLPEQHRSFASFSNRRFPIAFQFLCSHVLGTEVRDCKSCFLVLSRIERAHLRLSLETTINFRGFFKPLHHLTGFD